VKMKDVEGFKDELTKTIVDLEVNKSEWTLMHRFHAVTDMLEGVSVLSSGRD